MADTKFERETYENVQDIVGLNQEERDYILELIDRDIDLKELA